MEWTTANTIAVVGLLTPLFVALIVQVVAMVRRQDRMEREMVTERARVDAEMLALREQGNRIEKAVERCVSSQESFEQSVKADNTRIVDALTGIKVELATVGATLKTMPRRQSD